MKILLCDGPHNGDWVELGRVVCTADHESRVDSLLDHLCACGEMLFFRVSSGIYCYDRWADDHPEVVGKWVHDV